MAEYLAAISLIRASISSTSRGWIDGQTVVIVDDVLYTGRTIRAALDEPDEADLMQDPQDLFQSDRRDRPGLRASGPVEPPGGVTTPGRSATILITPAPGLPPRKAPGHLPFFRWDARLRVVPRPCLVRRIAT